MLEKTIFGNYRKKSVEKYIEFLKKEHATALEKFQNENTYLKEQINEKIKQEFEIGEAIIHAKKMIRESREQAQRQAEEILSRAQEEYNQVQQSMFAEITELTEKRLQAERIYQEHVAKIKRTLDSVNRDLENNIEGATSEQKIQRAQLDNVIRLNDNTNAF